MTSLEADKVMDDQISRGLLHILAVQPTRLLIKQNWK